MIGRKVLVNVIAFVLVSAGLVGFGVVRFLLPAPAGRTLTLETADASGLLPRSDVTIRGVPSGAVRQVDLTDRGTAMVIVALKPDVTVPEGTTAHIMRRSPIGDITLELVPGDGPTLPDGGHIPLEDTVPPPNAERTVEVLADVLGAVSPEDLDTVVHELSVALDGRGRDLGGLAVDGADLSERILRVREELESLIRTGPKVLDVLAKNARTLGDDIAQTALLADILRDRRFDLVELMRSGADFAEVFGELLRSEKPNLACLVEDFGDINAVLARPGNLRNLADSLDLNHFFFDAVEQSVQPGKDGLDWFRVHFLPQQQPPARPYNPDRPPPDVFAGDSCHTRYGHGVGPGSQPHPPKLVPGSQLHPGR